MGRGAMALASGAVLLLGCGERTPLPYEPVTIGKHAIGLDEPCDGVYGLTGRAILDQRADRFAGTLVFFDGNGARVDPTELTIDLRWPATPTATCYEPVCIKGTWAADARVAIEGLTMRVSTADGTFDETLPAKAWLPMDGIAAGSPLALAVTVRSNLRGGWQPPPEFVGQTIGFFAPLPMERVRSDGTRGDVELGEEHPFELDAAIFWKDRLRAATW